MGGEDVGWRLGGEGESEDAEGVEGRDEAVGLVKEGEEDCVRAGGDDTAEDFSSTMCLEVERAHRGEPKERAPKMSRQSSMTELKTALRRRKLCDAKTLIRRKTTWKAMGYVLRSADFRRLARR